MKLNHDLITNVIFEGIDHADYPDFVDAYIVSADYKCKPMTEEQIESISEDWAYDCLMKQLF
jgi:hypothetical protein